MPLAQQIEAAKAKAEAQRGGEPPRRTEKTRKDGLGVGLVRPLKDLRLQLYPAPEVRSKI